MTFVTRLLGHVLAVLLVAFAFPAASFAQQCQSFTTDGNAQWGPNTNQTFNYTQRVQVFNNCADAAQILMTTPDDPLSRALLSMSYTTSGGGDTKQFVQGLVDQNIYVLARVVGGVTQTYTVASGATEYFCLPDAGAASGNLKFVFGCTQFDSSNTGLPMNCLIGSDPGRTSNGMDTLFEFTSGCKFWGTGQQNQCTYNPSDPTKTERLETPDYFDTSAVTAYSIPMSISIFDPANPTSPTGWQTYGCSYPGRDLIADLASCPTETSSTISSEYNCPSVASGISLRLANQNTGWGSYSTACIAFNNWRALFGPGLGGGCNVAMSTTPAGTASPTPNVADYYGCSLLPFAGWDAYAKKCLTPGCGGPQCAVGPDGTQGVYITSKVAQGKGVPYMNYVKTLKATGNEVYTWMFDDGVGTLQCATWGSSVKVTLCPGQAGQKPYDTANQKWSYNASTNRCVVNTAGTYSTQIACMAANAKYACDSETVSKLDSDNPGYIAKAQLNYCKPLDPGAVTPSQFAAGATLAQCQASQCQQTGKLNTGDVPATNLILLGQ